MVVDHQSAAQGSHIEALEFWLLGTFNADSG
jgi:hypothetical protein